MSKSPAAIMTGPERSISKPRGPKIMKKKPEKVTMNPLTASAGHIRLIRIGTEY